MLKKLSESTGNVIGFQAIGSFDKADCATLTEEVQAAIDDSGSVRLLVDIEQCVADNVSAWAADLDACLRKHDRCA